MLKAKLISFVATRFPERALNFYSKILGLTLQNYDPAAMVFEANGTMLRVQRVR